MTSVLMTDKRCGHQPRSRLEPPGAGRGRRDRPLEPPEGPALPTPGSRSPELDRTCVFHMRPQSPAPCWGGPGRLTQPLSQGPGTELPSRHIGHSFIHSFMQQTRLSLEAEESGTPPWLRRLNGPRLATAAPRSTPRPSAGGRRATLPGRGLGPRWPWHAHRQRPGLWPSPGPGRAAAPPASVRPGGDPAAGPGRGGAHTVPGNTQDKGD